MIPPVQVAYIVMGLFLCDGVPATLAVNNIPKDKVAQVVEVMKSTPVPRGDVLCKYKKHRVFNESTLEDAPEFK